MLRLHVNTTQSKRNYENDNQRGRAWNWIQNKIDNHQHYDCDYDCNCEYEYEYERHNNDFNHKEAVTTAKIKNKGVERKTEITTTITIKLKLKKKKIKKKLYFNGNSYVRVVFLLSSFGCIAVSLSNSFHSDSISSTDFSKLKSHASQRHTHLLTHNEYVLILQWKCSLQLQYKCYTLVQRQTTTTIRVTYECK